MVRADWDAIWHDPLMLTAHRLRRRDLEQPHLRSAERGSVAGDDLDSSLIVPLIKRAEPEGAGGSSPLSFPEQDTPIAEELAGELYVFYGFDLPGAFRLVSRRDCARMQLDAGDLRPLAVRNLTRRRARPQIRQAPADDGIGRDQELDRALFRSRSATVSGPSSVHTPPPICAAADPSGASQRRRRSRLAVVDRPAC